MAGWSARPAGPVKGNHAVHVAVKRPSSSGPPPEEAQGEEAPMSARNAHLLRRVCVMPEKPRAQTPQARPATGSSSGDSIGRVSRVSLPAGGAHAACRSLAGGSREAEAP